MSDLPIRLIFPAHRFLEEDRATDGDDGLCVYRIDGSSGEFCDRAKGHRIHDGVDEPRYEHTWGEDR